MALKPFDEAKLFIAVPHLSVFSPEFTIPMMSLAKGPNHRYFFSGYTYLDMTRNECVRQFMQTDMDYLMFIDSDMVPPENAIERLYSHDVDIVGGLYFMRGFPYSPIAYYKNDATNWLGQETYRSIEEDAEGKGLLEVDTIGTGFMLIKRWVLEEFWNTDHANPHSHGHSHEECLCVKCSKAEECKTFKTEHMKDLQITECGEFDCREIMPFRLGFGYGEDKYFCKYAKENLAARIFVDRDLIIGHIITAMVLGKTIDWKENKLRPKIMPLA